MGWPFGAAAPSLDTGQTDVPTSATLITVGAGTSAWLMGATFTNTGNEDILVTMTDGSDVQIGAWHIPGGGVPVNVEWPFMPQTGVKWLAAASGIKGKVWGYV